MTNKKYSNHLIHETSPYLLQHAHNPVEWYPWGEQAKTRAKKENKPIFLSIGYSACHWCHVMENESFENEEIAKVMNDHFINIKVDREERPDLDHIYMNAVQIMTQHGGWPLSVFLTPHLDPFYGGTYYPPENRHGMPGFKKILLGVHSAWTDRPEEILTSAKQLKEALEHLNQTHGNTENVATDPQPAAGYETLIQNACENAIRNYDEKYGGFGVAPKFFHTQDLRLLLRQWKKTKASKYLDPVVNTLQHMARGGISDHIGGGFHRYSTDRMWLVPHFEKMLYDNALLAETYLEAYQATSLTEFIHVARDTLNYVLREMTSEEGGFFSTQDADTDGVEGGYYVWTKHEIEKVLDQDLAQLFCKIYNVTDNGNWENHSILNYPHPIEYWEETLGVPHDWLEDSLATAKRKLQEVRSKRSRPLRDEKTIVSWNGLMIHSMALGYQVCNDDRYLDAAIKSCNFIWEKCCSHSPEPHLMHSFKDGKANLPAYLDDYASLLNAVVTIYESTFDEIWLDRVKALASSIISRFWDPKNQYFYFTSTEHEKLITRPKEIHDGSTPSATALAITGLLRSATLLAQQDWLDVAEIALKALLPVMAESPSAMGQSLIALDFMIYPPIELVLSEGKSHEASEAILRAVREKFLPYKVMAVLKNNSTNNFFTLKGKISPNESETLYACQNFTCEEPISGVQAIIKKINSW